MAVTGDENNRILATNGEAGMQAQTLAPGLYWAYWPWQYSIKMESFTGVAEGNLGLIKAKDGEPLNVGRILALPVECDKFQDAEKFLLNKGQKGPLGSISYTGKLPDKHFSF